MVSESPGCFVHQVSVPYLSRICQRFANDAFVGLVCHGVALAEWYACTGILGLRGIHRRLLRNFD